MTKSQTADSTSTSNRRGKATLGTQGSGTTVFQCQGFGDCRMVFTRSEHLARHIRKHTGERPFQCHCQKSFSRLDNLRQHCQTVHSDTPELNQELLRKLTTLHTNLASSVVKNQQQYNKCFRKIPAEKVNVSNPQKRKSSSPSPTSEDRNKRRHLPQGEPEVSTKSLPPHEESSEARYGSAAMNRRSYSPPMVTYSRPASYSYLRRPYPYAYPSDVAPSRYLSYPSSRADHVSNLHYQVDQPASSWSYAKYESPSSKLSPLKTSGPLSLPGSNTVDSLSMRPSLEKPSTSPKSRLALSFPPPAPLSHGREPEMRLPPISKSSVTSTQASSVPHSSSKLLTRSDSSSLSRPSLPNVDSITSEPRSTRLMSGMTPSSGSLPRTSRYRGYSSMDEFQHSSYALPSHAMHRLMDISPAGLGLTSSIPSYPSRSFPRQYVSGNHPLRSIAPLDGTENKYIQSACRWKGSLPPMPPTLDDYTRSPVPEGKANYPHPLVSARSSRPEPIRLSNS